MNCLFHASSYTAALFSNTSRFIARTSLYGCSTSSWKRNFECAGIRRSYLEFALTRFRVQCYSTKKGSGSKPRARKLDSMPVMEEEKEEFFVMRKGDVVGVYKSFSDCQAQVGYSICDPPVSVYKGHSMPKDTKDYLLSHGLKNSIYAIRAADLKEDLFGTLVPCSIQVAVGATTMSTDASRKHLKLDGSIEARPSSDCQFCILEFDGASKGNPGPAGAGVVLRAGNGNVIWRLREGLGIATCNAAEYRAIILGLKYALKKGYRSIRVRGDSKLVCMQVQGLWKVRNKNMAALSAEVKKLKDMFLSFEVGHVLRAFNSEADAQANLAVSLADGQVQEELENQCT